MFLYRGEVGEELRQQLGDFPPDGPGGVLLLGRRHPAGDDVVSVDLHGEKRGRSQPLLSVELYF